MKKYNLVHNLLANVSKTTAIALVCISSSVFAQEDMQSGVSIDPVNNPICAKDSPKIDLGRSLEWQRHSAERKAISNLTYSSAKQYIKSWLKDPENKNDAKINGWGVILDVDETTLDNSWYLEECKYVVANENAFSQYVVIPAKSTAIPGAKEFTNWVAKNGGYVSIVTNRDGSYNNDNSVMQATEKNLRDAGIYFDQIILANNGKLSTTARDKNPRFQAVKSGIYDDLIIRSNTLPKHKVIAYFGDNIQDFPNLNQANLRGVDGDNAVFSKFGKGYFILPNSTYGSWVGNSYK